MAIKLIRDDERLTFVFSEDQEVKIHYKRIPSHIQDGWLKKNTDKKNRIDYFAVGLLAMKYAILGWEGIENENGPVKYDPVNADELIPRLPGALVGEFTEELLDGTKREEKTKNSSTTRSSG